MKKVVKLSLIFILISLSIVSAVPPQTFISSGTQGVSIEYPLMVHVKVNEGAYLHFQTFNATSGKRLKNDTLSCSFFLANSTGTIIYSEVQNVTFEEPCCWHVTLNKSLLFKNQMYNYHFYCNSTEPNAIGGFVTSELITTETGERIETYQMILPFILILLGILLFGLGCIFKDNFMVRTAFFIFALLFSLLAINSASILVAESPTLRIMSQGGLILTISITSFMFLYIMIYWTIMTIRLLKHKEELRWQY